MTTDLSPRIGQVRTTTAGGETVRAYIPQPLPPSPPLDLVRLLPAIERANQALGRLDGITSILPSPPLFIYMYIRKEAVLSSQIEGTQSSLSDLLLFEHDELPMLPLDDVREVSNYDAAMSHGLDRLEAGSPCRSASSGKSTACYSPRGAARARTLASSAPRKIGSAAPARATPCSCPRRPTS